MGTPYTSKAKSIITCEVSDQTSKIDSKIKISGSIWPVHMALVFIQLSKDEGETWDNLGMATTENGIYSYEWIPKVQGAYLLRSFWTGDMDHKKMTSPTVRVDIT